jgi:hypothetical protein
MRAFQVGLNGKRLCLAGIGIGNDGVLSCIVNWVARAGKGDLFLQVGGLVRPTEEHVGWIGQRRLRVGDRIQVQVVEKNSTDEPARKYRLDPKEQTKAKKRYVRALAKELGWTIQATPTRRRPAS